MILVFSYLHYLNLLLKFSGHTDNSKVLGKPFYPVFMVVSAVQGIDGKKSGLFHFHLKLKKFA